MSRSKPKNRRVAPANAKRSLPRSFSVPRSTLPLRLTEDRRTFDPRGTIAPARSFSRPRHRLITPTPKPTSVFFSAPRAAMAFEASPKVLICVRRRIRKEVLHAMNKTGRTGQRRPRRNAYSDVSC